ncbi:MAG: hypothetical protein U0670_04440 [Anaerolineae bacterium]
MLSLQLLRLLIRVPRTPSNASPLLRRMMLLEASQTMRGREGGDTQESLLFPPFKRVFPFVRLLAIIVLPVLTILLFLPSLLVLYVSLFSYTTLIAPLVNIVFGLILAMMVARWIGFERERKSYDLLALIPMGRFGLHVTYCRNWLHTHSLYGWMLFTFLCIGTVSLAFGIGLLPTLIPDSSVSDSFLVSLFQRVLLIGTLIADALQSLVTAALIGMVAPAYYENRANAQMGAAAGVLGVQIAAYGVFYTLSAVLMPLLLSIFPAGLAVTGATLVIAAIFLVMREGLITALWRMLRVELGAGDEWSP